MREHKYKAKCLDNGEWIEGYLWRDTTSSYYIRKEIGLKKKKMVDFEVNPDTICEFTGYHDSSKQKIYQNDVVRFYLGDVKLCDYLIWWNNEMQCMSAVDLKWVKFNGFDYFDFNNPRFRYEDFCFMLQDHWGDYSKIEVIGNIFDNPKLLEVK